MKKISAVLLFIMSASMAAAAQSPYYQGKQIKVVVGFTTGGFYDRWARLMARRLFDRRTDPSEFANVELHLFSSHQLV